jgi:hypothetical protein
MRSPKAPSSHVNYAPRAGAHIGGSANLPPAFDAEIARLFTELRQYLGRPVAHIAQHLGTHPNVIAALEAGRIDLLPGWNETARVVSGYIALARLDSRPALDRLAMLMGVSIPVRRGNPAPSLVQPPADAAATPVARILGRLSEAALRARSEANDPGILVEWVSHLKETVHCLVNTVRLAHAPVRWVMAGALALIVVFSAAPSGVLQASVSGLSQPISGLWRKISGHAGEARVILRGGLKWIEAEDPRDRRSDKLPSRRS